MDAKDNGRLENVIAYAEDLKDQGKIMIFEIAKREGSDRTSRVCEVDKKGRVLVGYSVKNSEIINLDSMNAADVEDCLRGGIGGNKFKIKAVLNARQFLGRGENKE